MTIRVGKDYGGGVVIPLTEGTQAEAEKFFPSEEPFVAGPSRGGRLRDEGPTVAG